MIRNSRVIGKLVPVPPPKKVEEVKETPKPVVAVQKKPTPAAPPKRLHPEFDTVACPHCERNFKVSTADRHIPLCATAKSRPKPPPTKDQIEKTIEMRR